MADRDIFIGRAINVTGMIGVMAERSYSLPRLWCSYFDVALGLIFRARFAGSGS
jgi:hypothetical protein